MVVVDLGTVAERDPIARLVDAAHEGVSESHVRGVSEDRADREGHVGRLESGRRDLVEQRLERVEVVLVDDGDPDVLVGQDLGGCDPRKTPTDDHDVRE